MSDNRRQFDDKGLYDDDKTRIFQPVNKTKKDFFDDDELVDIGGEKKYSRNVDSYSQEDKESYNDGFDMESQPEDDYSFEENRNNIPYNAMNGHNHNNPKGGKKAKKSNAPMIVSIISSVIAVILIVVLVIVFTNSCDKEEENTNTSTTEATTSMNIVATDTTEYVSYSEDTSQETTEETTTEETTEVTTQQPTQLPNLINANFLPYKCITPDGDRITSDFNTELGGEASISLTKEGYYTLAAGSIANASGSYTIDGNYLMLDSGYTGTVSFDDAGNPVAVIVSVEGYQIYFN
ncbi:MAG: hypothetical protein J1F17_07175 [Oscillospiraceae bacterium]|nr:hypothetical protein [Oscillospiraceae bacterium]